VNPSGSVSLKGLSGARPQGERRAARRRGEGWFVASLLLQLLQHPAAEAPAEHSVPPLIPLL